MRIKAKKVVRLLLGWGFIVGGIVGLFLPLLQGVLFLFVGLLILSSEYVWADNLLRKIRTRFPVLSSRFDQAAAKAHKWTSRRFHHTQRDSWRNNEDIPIATTKSSLVVGASWFSGCEDPRDVRSTRDGEVTGHRREQESRIYPG